MHRCTVHRDPVRRRGGDKSYSQRDGQFVVSIRSGDEVRDRADVSAMRLVVLRRNLQPEPESVLRLRAARRPLLGALRHDARLERPVRHHQQSRRHLAVIAPPSCTVNKYPYVREYFPGRVFRIRAH